VSAPAVGSPGRSGSASELLQSTSTSTRPAGLNRPEPTPITPLTLVHTIQQLSTLEACLWSILEGMKSSVTYVAFFCREYWGTSASKAQASLEKFEWNDRLKRQVQQACVLESLSLAVASHLCSGTMQDVSVTVRSRLRNLLYYIHENCLVMMDLLRQRLQFECQNPWTELAEEGMPPGNLNFDILIRVNRYRQLRKGEHVMALKQHNEMITNVLRQLCRGATSKPTLARGRNSGEQSPGVPRGSRLAQRPGGQTNVLSAVNTILASSTPLDRLRPKNIRGNMMQYMRFQPLLNIDGEDIDSPWPAVDPYDRFGADKFATDGPIIWFEPLPPMMADLDRIPALPPPPADDSYCLVLDLDETLVHYFEDDGVGNYGIRPYMFEFLQRMNQLNYEIVIFTAATQDYADWVIGQIDPDGLIHYRLYRQHALPWGPLFAKDLSRLGRDLERTLIIDNVQENFMLHPQHGIFISTWYDDPQDTALSDLTPLLEELITTRARVPDLLDKYRDQIPIWAGFKQYGDGSDGLDGDPSYEGSAADLTAPLPHGDQYGQSGLGDGQGLDPADAYGAHTQQTGIGMQADNRGGGGAGPAPYAHHSAAQQQQAVAEPRQQPAPPQRAQFSGVAGPCQAPAPPQRQPQAPAPQPQPQRQPQQQAQPQQQQAQQTRQQQQFATVGQAQQPRPAFTASRIAGPYQAQQSVPQQQVQQQRPVGSPQMASVGAYQHVPPAAAHQIGQPAHDFNPYTRGR